MILKQATSINVDALSAQKIYLGDTLVYDGVITDLDAATYIANVEAADSQALGYTQGLEMSVKQAINSFVVGCKNDNIWSSMSACCILAGARTLSGALVPLKGAAPTSYNFLSANYNRVTGLNGGSTSDARYLDTNRLNSEDAQNFVHAAAYVYTSNNGVVLGSDNSLGAEIGIRPYNGASSYIRAHDTNPTFTPSPAATAPGLVGVARISSSNLEYIYPSSNGTLSAFRSPTTVTTPNKIFLFRRNNTSAGYYGGRIAFYSLGGFLDLAKLNIQVNTLMLNLSVAMM